MDWLFDIYTFLYLNRWCDDQYNASDRYCLAVTVIGFAYSAFQVYNLSYQLVTGKYAISHHLRRHFDFFMDQVSRAAYPSCLALYISDSLEKPKSVGN